MALNSNDRFRESCFHFTRYPENLLCKVAPKHRIEEYQEKFKDHAAKELFDDTTDPYVGCLEVRDGEEGISIMTDPFMT